MAGMLVLMTAECWEVHLESKLVARKGCYVESHSAATSVRAKAGLWADWWDEKLAVEKVNCLVGLLDGSIVAMSAAMSVDRSVNTSVAMMAECWE